MGRIQGKKILLTGGTGFIGSPLCQVLLEKGAKVFVLTHNTHTRLPQITSLSSLTDAAAHAFDIIINLAGETIAQKWTKGAKARIWRSRVDTTRALVQLMGQTAHKPEVFISASAVGYYGTDATRTFQEDTPTASPNSFAHTLCKAWETEALRAQDLGVRTVLLRLSPVLGRGGGMLEKLWLPFRLGLGGHLGEGQQPLSWIDRDDVLGLIQHIIETDTLAGPVNASAPQAVSNETFSKTLAKCLGRPCVCHVPGFVLKTVYGQMAEELMLQGQNVFPQKALGSGFVFSYGSLEASLKKIVGDAYQRT